MRERDIAKSFVVALWNIPTQIVFHLLDIGSVVAVFLIVIDDGREAAVYIVSMAVWLLSFYLMYRARVIEIARLKERIAEYEATEANIMISVQSRPHPPALAVENANFDPSGVPRYGVISVWLKLDNMGRERGQPVLQVDEAASNLPNGFSVNLDKPPDFNRRLDYVEARDMVLAYWRVYLEVAAPDVLTFADWLLHSSTFQIMVRYYTKRVGADSPTTVLLIKGDLTMLKKRMREQWSRRGLQDAVRLLGSDGSTS